MATSNKKQNSATSPKLVVDNSTINNEAKKEPITEEITTKKTIEKESENIEKKEKKEPIKKTIRKKAATDEKETTKKTSAKATLTSQQTTVKTSVVLQYQSIEVSDEVLIKMVKDEWVNAHNKSENEIENIELYIKPEEYSAYYVINNSIHGRLDL